jgi:hypothetical protein
MCSDRTRAAPKRLLLCTSLTICSPNSGSGVGRTFPFRDEGGKVRNRRISGVRSAFWQGPKSTPSRPPAPVPSVRFYPLDLRPDQAHQPDSACARKGKLSSIRVIDTAMVVGKLLVAMPSGCGDSPLGFRPQRRGLGASNLPTVPR